MAKDFRFGVGVTRGSSRTKLDETARRAEDLGFDVMHVPDHLGGVAPFPVMTTIAMATSRLRVGTFVINSAFYRPALLARDVGALRDLTGGRFELGLGTGYVAEEFDAAGIPFPSAGERVDHLRATTEYMAEHLPDVPIMIAGNGNRVLRIAARSADIIGLTGGDRAPSADEDPLAERITFVREAAGERFDSLELNLAITAMPVDGSGQPDLTIPATLCLGCPTRRCCAIRAYSRGPPMRSPSGSAATATATASATSSCRPAMPRRSRRSSHC